MANYETIYKIHDGDLQGPDQYLSYTHDAAEAVAAYLALAATGRAYLEQQVDEGEPELGEWDLTATTVSEDVQYLVPLPEGVARLDLAAALAAPVTQGAYVTAFSDGARFTMTTAFGTNVVVKLSNDEFSGITGRELAYFTFDGPRGLDREIFTASMRGERGYAPGAFVIWQHSLDSGSKTLTPLAA